MAIKYIDSVSIDGRGNSPERKLFNGYVHAINYNVGLANDKSVIVVSLVSEDGEYSIKKKDLTFSRVYSIKIGSNIKVNAYLVKYRKVVDGPQKLLELTFWDTSVKMDQHFVGLKNQHGQKSKDNFIIVGREIHPCDRDYDGDIDEIPDLLDECHPCRNMAVQELSNFTKVDCKSFNKYQIFSVLYNFSELIAELSKKFKIIAPKDPNTTYKANYTGTVREVLNSWTRDFGWMFYWEDDTIKFIDLKKTININARIEDFCPDLASYEEEYSIENNVDRIVASYYKRGGSADSYNCLDALYFEVPVLQPNRSDLGSELQITNKIPEVAAGLAQYDIILRDLWYYYDYYSLRGYGDYKINKFMPKIGLTILTTPILLSGINTSSGSLTTGSLTTGGLSTPSLQPSTGLFTPQGFPSSVDPSSSLGFLDSSPPTAALQAVQTKIFQNEKYKMCFEMLSAETQWVIANGLTKEPDDYFFFVGYYDSDLHAEHFAEERAFGSSFMGKYSVIVPDMRNEKHQEFFEDYTFKQDSICDIPIKVNDDKLSYSPLAVGNNDSAKFINTPTENPNGDVYSLAELPFKEWLTYFRDSRSAVSAPNRAIMFRLLMITRNNAAFHPSPSIKYNGETDEELPKDEIQNPELIGKAGKYSIMKLDKNSNDRGEFIPRKLVEGTGEVIDKTLDRTKIFIFVGRKIGTTDFRVVSTNDVNPTSNLSVPFDGKPTITEYSDIFDLNDPGEIKYAYPDLKCKQVGNLNPLCKRRSFATPIGAFTYYEPSYSNYGCVLEKRKEIKRKVQKLEMPFISKTKIDPTAASIDVIQKDIGDEEIRVFLNKDNSCRYNIEKIRQLHQLVSSNLNFVLKEPLEEKRFTVANIDLNRRIRVEDGLISISVGIGEDGIYSTYSLGTTLMKPILVETYKLLGDPFLSSVSKSSSNIQPPHNLVPLSSQ